MKKIFKKTELSWKCSYCGYLNDLSTNTCEKCGSVRSGEEEEKEITTDFERTTTEIQDNDSQNIIISTRGSHVVYLALCIVILLFFVVAPILYGIIHTKTENSMADTCKVLSKEWSYFVTVFEPTTSRVSSYIKPPADATNVETKQVMQENGWYKTEYTYDYEDWELVHSKTITGTIDPPTFKEYVKEKSNQEVKISDVNYSITVLDNEEHLTMNMDVSQDKWMSIAIGQTYSYDDLK